MTEPALIVRSTVDRASPPVNRMSDKNVGEASYSVAVPGLVHGHADAPCRRIAPESRSGEAVQLHPLDALRRWVDPQRRQMGHLGLPGTSTDATGDTRSCSVPPALRRSPEPTIRRMPANQVHQGRYYRYRLRGLREGRLTQKAGGWYTFDGNNDLKLHGAAEIMEEVAAPPAQSFATILLARAAQLGFTNDTVLSAAIQTVFADGDFAEDQILQFYLQTPDAVASCLQTAAALTDLFTAGGAPVAHGAAARNDGGSVTATGGHLAAAVNAGRAAGCLVRIRYGTHGFVVVVRADTAEVFQSFAGMAVPETLAFNLHRPRQLHTNNLLLILQEMAVADATLRAEAQIVICGDLDPTLNAECVLEDAEDAWPNLDFNWDVYALPNQATVLHHVTTRMQANIQNLNSRPGVGITP
ncbi:hypothetical protein [Nakamurella lactea]|uniref:hypothetical protein n=1 Tax=Nakamurella lactea TaxID=459515 RepID=UPI0012B56B80|nr:hypothetical protein [Nakamurella lactea]